MRRIPNPSQMDDWWLYHRLIEDEMMARFGVREYRIWRAGEFLHERGKRQTARLRAEHDRFIAQHREYAKNGHQSV